MTQDPPFQYVLLILTLSRKVIVQALSMMLIKKKEYISNSRGWINFSSFFLVKNATFDSLSIVYILQT